MKERERDGESERGEEKEKEKKKSNMRPYLAEFSPFQGVRGRGEEVWRLGGRAS